MAGLESPHRLIDGLPGIYQEDDLHAALGQAPSTRSWPPSSWPLDGLPGYLDPALTPEDFLEWLAWLGRRAPRRELAHRASPHVRGPGGRPVPPARHPAGLAAHVRIFTGGEVEIEDSGGVAWSATSGGALPGSPGYRVRVRVRGAPASVDQGRLGALVASAKPAHVVHSVEVGGGAPQG